MEQLAEVAFALLLTRARELLVQQAVVDRPLDVAEDADRRRAVRGVREPGQRVRERGRLGMLVVDEELVLGRAVDDLRALATA